MCIKKNSLDIGLISISATSIVDFPTLQIDFLIIDKNHRGLVLTNTCKEVFFTCIYMFYSFFGIKF